MCLVVVGVCKTAASVSPSQHTHSTDQPADSTLSCPLHNSCPHTTTSWPLGWPSLNMWGGIRLAHSAVSLARLPVQACSSISHGCPAEWDPICSRYMQHTYSAGQQHTTKQPEHMLACRHVLLNNSHQRCRRRHQLVRSSSPPHMQKLAQPGTAHLVVGGPQTAADPPLAEDSYQQPLQKRAAHTTSRAPCIIQLQPTCNAATVSHTGRLGSMSAA